MRRVNARAEPDLPFGAAADLVVERVAVDCRDCRERAIAAHRARQRQIAGAGRGCRFENPIANDEGHDLKPLPDREGDAVKRRDEINALRQSQITVDVTPHEIARIKQRRTIVDPEKVLVAAVDDRDADRLDQRGTFRFGDEIELGIDGPISGPTIDEGLSAYAKRVRAIALRPARPRSLEVRAERLPIADHPATSLDVGRANIRGDTELCDVDAYIPRAARNGVEIAEDGVIRVKVLRAADRAGIEHISS